MNYDPKEDTKDEEEVDDVVKPLPSVGDVESRGTSDRLSVTSQRYDRDNKGYLDRTESEMRRYDTSQRGFLTEEKVAKIVEDKLAVERKLSEYKKLMIFFAVLTVMLAAASIGTAYLAVKLQKDTETDSQAHLVTTSSGEIVKVEGVGHTVTIEVKQSFPDYQCMLASTAGTFYNALLSGTTSSMTVPLINSPDSQGSVLGHYVFSGDGVTVNATHVCVKRIGNGRACFLLEDNRCNGGDDGSDGDGSSRLRRHRFLSALSEPHFKTHRFLVAPGGTIGIDGPYPCDGPMGGPECPIIVLGGYIGDQPGYCDGMFVGDECPPECCMPVVFIP